jgi:hypothetical protein
MMTRFSIVILIMIFLNSVYAHPNKQEDIFALKKSIFLGEIHFDVSTKNAAAKEHFLLGTAFLQVFMYDLAIQQFQQAQQLDPTFAMSYWGEAMSYKHPLWNYENLKAAQAVLTRYEKNKASSLSDKEQQYLQAVKKLFSTQSIEIRDQLYIESMAQLYRQYPDDPNVGAFYALALLGFAADLPNTPSAIANTTKGKKLIDLLFKRYPQHPGVVHYFLHYHDNNDIEFAKEALPAAKITLTLMRSSSHATHMAAHIFRRLQLWDDYIKANQISVIASDELCKKINASPVYACDAENKYHSLEWLHDGYLKKQQIRLANKLVQQIQHIVQKNNSVLYKQWYYRMWARQVLVSKDWKMKAIPIAPISKVDNQLYWSSYSECGALLASGFLAMHQGYSITTQLQRLNTLIDYTNHLSDPYIKQTCQISKYELQAEMARVKGNSIQARQYARQALNIQKQQISTELTPSLAFLSAKEYYQYYLA